MTYVDTFTTAYTYDAGNRLTQVVDSIAGTITRTYDGLNRLTSETTPQGSVSYTYDAAGRRTNETNHLPASVFSYRDSSKFYPRKLEIFGCRKDRKKLLSRKGAKGAKARRKK